MKRDIEKRSFSFPPKPKVIINKVCKYTENLVTVNEIIDAVNWFFSEFGEMPMISDTGDCLFATTKIEASSVMASPYYATMGFGAPAAIGYAVTTGKRPLVLLGDGGFQMTGQEICHCPRYGINPIFIVFNNKRWGMQQSSIQLPNSMSSSIGPTRRLLSSGEAKATSVTHAKSSTKRLKTPRITRCSL
jgi:thiamine pyrophosphate-dependent acetolactate synthase large subunit-like protein